MYDKFFVGLDLTSAEDNGIQRPISRVTLLLDDENAVTAGDDTGLELSASCPHATQAMVNAILAQVKGYQYRMLQADDANLDPAAELGDGITAGGVYSVISRISDDGSGYSSVTAPGESEMEDEFPSSGPMTQEFRQKIAQTRSQIIKTAEAITLRVDKEIEGLSSSIDVKLDGITQTVSNNTESITTTLDLINGFTVTDESGTTKIKGSSLETGSIAANSIAADKLNLTGAITFEDLNETTRTKISTAESDAQSAKTTVSGWTYEGSTMINGNMIMADTVQASKLRGGQVQLLTQIEEEAGTITIQRSGFEPGASKGVVLFNADEIALQSNHAYGGIYLNTSDMCGITIFSGGDIRVRGNLLPDNVAGNVWNLGRYNQSWNDIYLSNDPIITSDRAQKTDISYDLDRYGALFDRLRPVSYKLINGQSGRTHLGLIAQDVEAALGECGLTDMDFAGLIRSPREDGGYDYALRYGEMIAMCINQIQSLKAHVTELERRITQ